MSWIETIRYVGLDLQIAAVFALGGLDAAARAGKGTWDRMMHRAPSLDRGNDSLR